VAQLTEGGRLVIPVGASTGAQELIQGRKIGGRLVTRVVLPVRFVPLVEPRR
jgi:protein-L-isoaspartate O-methyltransferase